MFDDYCGAAVTLVAPTVTNDRVCQSLTNCNVSQFQLTAPTQYTGIASCTVIE